MRTKHGVHIRNALAASDVLMVIATIGLVGLVLLPAVIRPNRYRDHARISCVNDLKIIGLSFRIYANDNDDLYPMAMREAEGGAKEAIERGEIYRVFQVMSNELWSPKTVACSADSRTPATDFANFDNSNISYFIGVDAVDTKPNMVLAGDRDLVIEGELRSGVQMLTTNREPTWMSMLHEHGGNILLADGSVQQVNSIHLNQLLKKSGDPTNRVVFPQ